MGTGRAFHAQVVQRQPHVMPRDVKLNRVDDRQLNKAHILDDLPFEWLLTSTKRVKPVVDELMEEFSEINEYSGRVGRLKTMLDQLSPGLVGEPAHIDSNGSRYFKFTNDSFNNHRLTQNKGGDFVVYSTVKRRIRSPSMDWQWPGALSNHPGLCGVGASGVLAEVTTGGDAGGQGNEGQRR
ncbi:MAG TPA: DUF6402 family protein [Archangium sp.]|uniref:DUF6402 family protein n=1 Tax=Archangium sp. TaxID=1872627 RepID=UPI002ED89EEC